MNHTFGLGLGLTAGALVGYAVGVSVSYPGRAFSVTVVMIGITLAAVGFEGGNGP
ncbi:hypothetical protein [Halalkalicoccus salilacus]|uniref:hypothetical protein n=1 Tax=Halalkalicoccus salilacus TaxID=3117459 RepID=UPI00300EA87A